MGNKNSKKQEQLEYSISVKTDRPYYYPGNKVFGKVYIDTKIRLDPKNISIHFKGLEKASYLKSEKTKLLNEEQKEIIEYHEQNFRKKLIDFKSSCFDFKGPLEPGEYMILFDFNLPEVTPSSIIFEDQKSVAKPSCKIKYRAIFTLNLPEKSIKYKHWVVIHERPVKFVEKFKSAGTYKVKQCCQSKG